MAKFIDTMTLLLRLLPISLILLFGQPAKASEHLWKNDKPTVYQVVKGDTLWDIASRFLNDPWRWNEVWKNNPSIQNPHLIYPGDEVHFVEKNGRGHLVVKRDGMPTYVENGMHSSRLSPKIRVVPKNEAIPTIPLKVLKPFLEHVDIKNSSTYKLADITALESGHILVGEGDLFYAKIHEHFSSQRFSVYREQKTIQDPKTKRVLGHEIELLGEAKMVQAGSLDTFKVMKSFSEISLGDHIQLYDEQKIDAYFELLNPEAPIKGQIVSIVEGIEQIGQYQVVVITGGKYANREAGQMLGIYQTPGDAPPRAERQKDFPKELPSRKIAEMVVFKVFDELSLALVMRAISPIRLHDGVARI